MTNTTLHTRAYCIDYEMNKWPADGEDRVSSPVTKSLGQKHSHDTFHLDCCTTHTHTQTTHRHACDNSKKVISFFV